MKLSHLRNIVEQDTSTSSVASTGTDSGDVATYPFPLSTSFIPNFYVLPSNRFMALSRRKRYKNKKYLESMDYTPWSNNDHSTFVAIEYLGKQIQKRLIPFGFSISIQEDMVDIVSNSGRIFEFKITDGYLTLSEGGTNISIDRQIGISADRPLFMAFPIPRGQSSNRIWEIAESSWWSILKYDVLLEVAPFVDYSGLDQKTLSRLSDHFIIVPKNEYRGTFDHLGLYKKIFSTNEKIKESMDLDHFKPINDWRAKFVHFDSRDLHDAVKDIEKFGTKPKQRGTDIYWNDDFRIKFSPNGIGIVEVSHAGHWYALHAIPIIPQEYQDEYVEELCSFIERYNKPKSFSGTWDMPDILWKIWESNAGEPNYNSAIAFHRNGLWGIDYTTAGMGRGTFNGEPIDAPIIQYRISAKKEGLEFRSEQVMRKDQVLNIGPTDIRVLFHNGFSVENIIRFIGRFTFSS